MLTCVVSASVDLSPTEARILRDCPEMQNWFRAPGIGPVRDACNAMVARGLLYVGRPAAMNGRFFHATPAGFAAVRRLDGRQP